VYAARAIGRKLRQIVRSLAFDSQWFAHLPSFARCSISAVTDPQWWRARTLRRPSFAHREVQWAVLGSNQ
jgi:hypothetical protein